MLYSYSPPVLRFSQNSIVVELTETSQKWKAQKGPTTLEHEGDFTGHTERFEDAYARTKNDRTVPRRVKNTCSKAMFGSSNEFLTVTSMEKPFRSVKKD